MKIHLFKVPNSWSNKKIEELVSSLQKSIEKESGLITREDVSHEEITLEKGEKVVVIREGDTLTIEEVK